MTSALTTRESDPAASGLTAPQARPPYPGLSRRLGKRQKAAIVVRLLLAEGAELSLKDLPESLQAELTRQMSSMRYIDRATLKAVIDEFVGEIEDIGLSFPDGIEGALSVLDGTISAATAARIRKLSGVRLTGDPWQAVTGLDPEHLLPVLQAESIHVAAILLSKLKVALAADLLGRLPGPQARRITYAMSQTGAVAPEVVEKIGRSLALQLEAQPVNAFSDGPVERVGAILNFSPAATRDEVLAGLDQDDAAFAKQVRKAIFTFANIPERIEARDVPKITRDVDQPVLITALAAATGDLQAAGDFILAGLSKRMAESLREEIENLGKVKARDGEAAMGRVVAAIRDLEAAGELVLIAEEDEDGEED